MANRYWVGGTGGWTNGLVNNWSETSGGMGGASIPTSIDDVFFDQAGTYEVALLGSLVCRSISVSQGTVTFVSATGTTPSLTISGSMFLVAGTVWSTNASLTFNSNTVGNTITVNGTTITGSITFNGIGGYWTLESALTVLGAVAVTNGTFDTSSSGNYSLTLPSTNYTNNGGTSNFNGSTVTIGYTATLLCSAGILNFGSCTINFTTSAGAVSGTGGTMNLGSSTINIGGQFTSGWSVTNAIVNPGTSTIVISRGNGGASFSGGGKTYYNLTTTNGSPISGNNTFLGTVTCLTSTAIAGSNTFNNLVFSNNSSLAFSISIGADQIVTGTFTTNQSGDFTKRIIVQSDVSGTRRKIIANSVVLQYTDFLDIEGAGTATWSGTSLGNCGGNAGITFSIPKTVYWNLGGNAAWVSNGWASVSGGTPDVANFPLAQDTAIFDDAGSAGTISLNSFLTYGGHRVGTIDSSSRTTAFTITDGNTPYGFTVHGNWINGSGISALTGCTLTFSNRSSQTITSAAKQFGPVTINSTSGSLILGDNFSSSSNVNLTGTLDLNGKTLTLSAAATAQFTVSGTSNITFNGGSLILNPSGTVFNNGSTILTTTEGTAPGTISLTSASAKTFAGGSAQYNCTINQGGAGALSITGSNYFKDITNTHSSTGATTITFPGGGTNTFFNFSATGTVGKVLTINATSASTLRIANRPSTLNYIAATNLVTDIAPLYLGTGSTATSCTRVFASSYIAPFVHYWVGGTGTWNSSNTTNWSSTSGGTGGSAVPFGDEDVVFDSASSGASYSVTVGNPMYCRSWTTTQPSSGTVSFANTTSGILNVSGNISYPNNIASTYWFQCTMNLYSINSNNTISGTADLFQALTVNITAPNGSITLLSNFNGSVASINLLEGTFNLGGYTAYMAGFSSTGTRPRTLNMTNSTFNIQYGITVDSTTTIVSTGSTLNLGVGINTIPTVTASLGGKTYNNITVSGGASFTVNGEGSTINNLSTTNGNNTIITGNNTITGILKTSGFGPVTISGNNTINNLQLWKRPSATASLFLGGNQNITGSISTVTDFGAGGGSFIYSNTLGTPRTLQINSATGLASINFRDIVVQGAAAPLTGTAFGDCRGNSGITFDAPRILYWRGGNGTWSTATTWSLTNGGTAITTSPLPQDTVVFTNASNSNASYTFTFNGGEVGSINIGTTLGITLGITVSGNMNVYGDLIWTDQTFGGTTFSGTGTLTFCGTSIQTITPFSSVSITSPININSRNSTVQLGAALSTSNNLSLTTGTFDAKTYNITALRFYGGGAASTLKMGTATWTLTAQGGAPNGDSWIMSPATGFIFDKGTANISFAVASNAKMFYGGGLTYNSLILGGTGTPGQNSEVLIYSSNTFDTITATGNVSLRISFAPNITTTVNNWIINTTNNPLTISNIDSVINQTSNLVCTGNNTILIDNPTLIECINVSPHGRWYTNRVPRVSSGFVVNNPNLSGFF